jgi:hypothetical protein
MTFQLGMVGKDGVLIASDTQWNDETGLRHSWNETKVKVNRDAAIVIACAGKLVTAGYLANEIINETIQNNNWMVADLGAKQRIEDKVLSLASDGSEHCQCQVVFMRPAIKLYCFQIVKTGKRWGLVIDVILSKKFTGDYKNSAIFWAERYYLRGLKVPIRTLVPLAAQSIISAHLLNTAGISGLEIVLCDDSGVYRLPDDELERLENLSIERDRKLRESLLCDTA